MQAAGSKPRCRIPPGRRGTSLPDAANGGRRRLPSLKVTRDVLDGYRGRPVALQRMPIGWLGLGLSVLLHGLVLGAVLQWTPAPVVERAPAYTVVLWQEPPVIRLAEGAPGAPEPPPAPAPVKPPPAPVVVQAEPPPAPLPVSQPVSEPEPQPTPPPIITPPPRPALAPMIAAAAPTPAVLPLPQAAGAAAGSAAGATGGSTAGAPGGTATGDAPAAGLDYGEGGAGGERGADGLQILDPAYWRAVRAAVARHVRYPEAAQRTGVEGLVTIRLTLDPAGRVLDARPVEIAAPELLARAALDAIRRAAPFPAYAQPLPPGARLSVLLPIRFQLEDRARNAGRP